MQSLEPVEVERRALAAERVVGSKELQVLRRSFGGEVLEESSFLGSRRLLGSVASPPAVVGLRRERSALVTATTDDDDGKEESGSQRAKLTSRKRLKRYTRCSPGTHLKANLAMGE